MTAFNTMDVARLREVLHYCPDTGKFTWAKTRGRAVAGAEAGLVNQAGYRRIEIDYLTFQASRLAWAYMTGAFPVGLVDHISRDRDDNRWSNLREATKQQNNRNRYLHKNSTTGLKGVNRRESGKYRAIIRVDGVRKHLGQFDTAEEAHEAYMTAANQVFGVFATSGERP